MICIPLISPDPAILIQQSSLADLAEVRIDLCGLGIDEVKKVFSVRNNLVATCRPGKYSDGERSELLKAAIESGAKYVDIEIENNEHFKNDLIQTARINRCWVIISYHNFEFTPSVTELERIVETCFQQGADVAKIAVMVQKSSDSAAILSLYHSDRRLVAIGMGELGVITRVASPLLGAEFTFASLNESESTAPGQISIEKMKNIITLL